MNDNKRQALLAFGALLVSGALSSAPAFAATATNSDSNYSGTDTIGITINLDASFTPSITVNVNDNVGTAGDTVTASANTMTISAASIPMSALFASASATFTSASGTAGRVAAYGTQSAAILFDLDGSVAAYGVDAVKVDLSGSAPSTTGYGAIAYLNTSAAASASTGLTSGATQIDLSVGAAGTATFKAGVGLTAARNANGGSASSQFTLTVTNN